MQPTRQAIVDLVVGRWRSQILHAGVRLGIFEALREGTRSADDVARALGLDPARAYRLMRALGALGLLVEDGARRFRATPVGAHLFADHPESVRAMALLEEGPEHYAIWRHLCDIVRDGGPNGFEREFGRPIFAHAAESEQYAAVFDEAMSSYSQGETAMVLAALEPVDFTGVAHVCDVGGGRGHLLCGLLQRHPHLRGTLYDRGPVLADPSRLWSVKLGLEERCASVPGDMFEHVPAADAYFMKHILHDWNDEECVRILANARASAADGARVFVAEFLVSGPETPDFAKVFDVHMLCATTGQERTEGEYAALLARAGWRHVATRLSGEGGMGVVEGATA
jgi:hypothetical protein